ncbi:MAG: type II toxin-antitoxin system VapC family toxin [Anaerolineae bacterium]|nr:type II toxin-antitoxin system VapC family toxin [Anaerolineae bacterium]
MPGPYTVDASVFLNAFNVHEAGQPDSQRFLAHLQAEAIPIVVPTLLLPEVSATIARGSGDPALPRQFVAALIRLPHLVLVSLDTALARQTAEVAALHRVRGSDAVYATVALRFGSTLVTLDREQHNRLASVLTPRYPPAALSELGL